MNHLYRKKLSNKKTDAQADAVFDTTSKKTTRKR